MKKLWIIVVVLLSALAWASDKQESIESLKARADQAQPKDQVVLFTRIAERQLDALDKAYNGGTVREAQAALADVVTYGVKAAQVSGETGKRMKQTEIAMRKIAATPGSHPQNPRSGRPAAAGRRHSKNRDGAQRTAQPHVPEVSHATAKRDSRPALFFGDPAGGPAWRPRSAQPERKLTSCARWRRSRTSASS